MVLVRGEAEMTDPKKQAEYDQAAAFLTEHLPALWKQMYDGLVAVGFNENQAMDLLKVYVHAAANGRGQL